MREWLESIAGPAYATAMMWTLGALLLLLVVLLLIKIVRNLTFGTFVSGGRNRKARLAVMDAAAVDSHRRLVLVRRDDVEHLILIGGPTDVVVEQNIRLAPPQRRPAAEEREHAAEERPRPAAVIQQPAPSPEPAVEPAARPAPLPRPAPAAAPVAPARPVVPPSAGMPPRQSVAPTQRPSMPFAHPASPSAEKPAAQVAAASAVPAPAPPQPPDLDQALREELEVTLDESKPRADDDLPESVEDEMSKLLGELSRTRR